ncbi:MAG TPA: hypothetical protein VKH62_00855 [Candidatus Binatia bacterium]|nr:hypothetical protein [Candidatus Binatia bacterium]
MSWFQIRPTFFCMAMVSPRDFQVNSSEDEIQLIAWIENIGWSLVQAGGFAVS